MESSSSASPQQVLLLGSLLRQAMQVVNCEVGHDESTVASGPPPPHQPGPSTGILRTLRRSPGKSVPTPRKKKNEKMKPRRRLYQKMVREAILKYGLNGRRNALVNNAVEDVMTDMNIRDDLSNRSRIRHDIGETINNMRRYKNRVSRKLARQEEEGSDVLHTSFFGDLSGVAFLSDIDEEQTEGASDGNEERVPEETGQGEEEDPEVESEPETEESITLDDMNGTTDNEVIQTANLKKKTTSKKGWKGYEVGEAVATKAFQPADGTRNRKATVRYM